MPITYLNVRMKQRIGLASEWKADNPLLLKGELGIESDTGYVKSGDGSTRYEQNDVVAEQTCKGTFLVCTTAGTTAASAPSGYSSVAEGGSVTDGTAVFTAHRFNNLANIAAIIAHNALETAHPSLDFIKSLSAASDGIHYRTRNGKSDQVLDLINQLQATLSQETVPSGNTGSLAALLSGIVHQIAALSGKSNWWETPKDSFETLSAGVVAGDVSNPNSWWVKLGGTIPIIIQGGIGGSRFTYPLALSRVLTVAFSLNSGVWSYNWYTQDSKVNISNTAASNPKGFPYNWLVIGIA